MAAAPIASSDLPVHLLFPFTSSLLYVAAALSLKRASLAGAGVWRSTLVMNVVVAVCFLPLLGSQRGGGPWPVWQAAVIGGLFVVGQALTMLALSRGDVSVATPVIGTKVVFVAVFVTLLVGDPLAVDYWVSAGMSAAGIALLNLGGGGSPAAGDGEVGEGEVAVPSSEPAVAAHAGRNLGFTVGASLAAAACYALFDVLVRKWAPAWGIGLLLPSVMASSAVMSLALWPAMEGRLRDVPGAARGPLALGSVFIGVQALLLTRTLGLYPDTTRINVVYNSRGLWSVLAVWLVGHWWGNTERHAGRSVFLWRMAGAALLLGAIVVAVVRPISG